MVQRFIPYGCQSINQEDIEAVTRALQSEIITRGPLVEEFENALADYCGVNFAVAFNSGTSALTAALNVAEVNANDRLITSPNTFIGTLVGGELAKASTVLVDIDPETGNIDLDLLEHNLNTPSTRGKEIIMPVHFAGVPVDMALLEGMVMNSRTMIIEDAAHALGSYYPTGERVGSCQYSQMTVFSFHPAKTITTGEGGMVTTNDEEVYHRLQRYRNNGLERNPKYLERPLTPWYYEVQEVTGNFNFTDMQAALGLSQFKRLEKFIAKRERLLTRYHQNLKSASHLSLLKLPAKERCAHHLCVAKIDFNACRTTREKVMLQLRDQGIGTQVHYIPLYHHPYFIKKCGDLREYFPNTESYYAQTLSLPLHCEMDENDVDEICAILKSILKR